MTQKVDTKTYGLSARTVLMQKGSIKSLEEKGIEIISV